MSNSKPEDIVNKCSPESMQIVDVELVRLINILTFESCKTTFIHLKKVCYAKLNIPNSSLFKKRNTYSTGKMPVYLRVTVNSARARNCFEKRMRSTKVECQVKQDDRLEARCERVKLLFGFC